MGVAVISAIDIFVELRNLGVELCADGDRIGHRPGSLVTEGMRARIAAVKPELIALLPLLIDSEVEVIEPGQEDVAFEAKVQDQSFQVGPLAPRTQDDQVD